MLKWNTSCWFIRMYFVMVVVLLHILKTINISDMYQWVSSFERKNKLLSSPKNLGYIILTRVTLLLLLFLFLINYVIKVEGNYSFRYIITCFYSTNFEEQLNLDLDLNLLDRLKIWRKIRRNFFHFVWLPKILTYYWTKSS